MPKADKTVLVKTKKKKLPKAAKTNKRMDLKTMLQNDIQIPII
jgi:hypothetical protein